MPLQLILMTAIIELYDGFECCQPSKSMTVGGGVRCMNERFFGHSQYMTVAYIKHLD